MNRYTIPVWCFVDAASASEAYAHVYNILSAPACEALEWESGDSGWIDETGEPREMSEEEISNVRAAFYAARVAQEES